VTDAKRANAAFIASASAANVCDAPTSVGWSMADHMRAERVVDALEMALHRRHPGRASDVVHSTRVDLRPIGGIGVGSAGDAGKRSAGAGAVAQSCRCRPSQAECGTNAIELNPLPGVELQTEAV
jgi:transposase InsO family protein